jgi:hypothetical protein
MYVLVVKNLIFYYTPQTLCLSMGGNRCHKYVLYIYDISNINVRILSKSSFVASDP